MVKSQMKITTNDSDNMQSRIVIECNGFEIDILADDDGICCNINRLEGLEVASCSVDFDD